VFFQSKGVHDHPRPEAKSTAEQRRLRGAAATLGAGLHHTGSAGGSGHRRTRGLALLLARSHQKVNKVKCHFYTKTVHFLSIVEDRLKGSHRINTFSCSAFFSSFTQNVAGHPSKRDKNKGATVAIVKGKGIF
jgi:hypothetical protein